MSPGRGSASWRGADEAAARSYDQGDARVSNLDAGLVMRLTIDSIQFNFIDFFEGSLWKGKIPDQLLLIFSKPLTSTSLLTLLSRMGTGSKKNSGTEHTT